MEEHKMKCKMKIGMLAVLLVIFGPAFAMNVVIGPTPASFYDPPDAGQVLPASQTALTEDSYSFSLDSATGDPVLSYQWMYNGTDIPDETGTALTIVSAVLGNAGDYICRVTSGYGCDSLSLKGTLSVDQRLMFTEHPSDVNKTVGEELIFQAEAVGAGAYHWEKDTVDLVDGLTAGGNTITGANTRVLSIDSLLAVDAGSYVCQAVDSRVPAQTAASNPGVVAVNLLPPTLALTHADLAADMTAVFNSNGTAIQSVCAEALPGGTDLANVTNIGIDFVNMTTFSQVLEVHGIAVVPNVDTAAVIFTGAGLDLGGAPAQVADPLTLVGLECYILPWFEVSADPGTKYFFNPAAVKATLNGSDLATEIGFNFLNIPT